MLAPALCKTAAVAGWGEDMRRERESRGWKIVEVAARIGAVEGTVRNLEDSETMPVRSKHARNLMDLYGLGDDPVDATNPRLRNASAAQLARRLAELLEAEEGERVKHDQSNVSAGSETWRRMPISGDDATGAGA